MKSGFSLGEFAAVALKTLLPLVTEPLPRLFCPIDSPQPVTFGSHKVLKPIVGLAGVFPYQSPESPSFIPMEPDPSSGSKEGDASPNEYHIGIFQHNLYSPSVGGYSQERQKNDQDRTKGGDYFHYLSV